MASNITTSAQFATQNMKPDPGEQGDALWAQKIAENTGQLLFRPYPILSFAVAAYDSAGGGFKSGTFLFRKEQHLGTFAGTFIGTHKASASDDVNIYVNGVNVFSRSYAGAATLFKQGTNYGIGGLTDGNYYEVSYSWNAGANSGPTGMGVSAWLIP